MFMPIIRADFSLMDSYQYKSEPPLTCAITVHGGSKDYNISKNNLQAWCTETIGNFELKIHEGDHFFIQKNRDEFLKHILDDLYDVIMS